MQPDASTASRTNWISRPWIDLLIGCGGWSLPLLAVSYTLTGDAAREWSGAFYSLALISNYPHYMATVYRAYGRDDLGAHRLYTVYGTSALIALAAVAHLQLWLVPWLFTAYVMWSPWHYTGQNFGLLLMFLRRAGVTVTTIERRRLYVAFVASYVMLLAAFNRGASTDPLVLSLGIPDDLTMLVTSASAFVFVIVGASAFISLARRTTWGDLRAPALLYTTQALSFVVPTALTSFSGLAIPQTRYSSGVLAVMHAAQYLWITQYFARREQGASWVPSRYWAAVIVGGMALFLPIPWIASYGAHIDFTASMLIVASVVNLHHFMLDGVVWKLRDKRVGQALGQPSSTVQLAPSAPPAPSAPWLRHWGLISAALALALLAVLDQWRYRLASFDADRSALQAAIALNPFDSNRYRRYLELTVAQRDRIPPDPKILVPIVLKFADALSRTGRTADARTQFELALKMSQQTNLTDLERLARERLASLTP